MEWLGILLLYLISGYMKKRNQDAKRRDIESDPDWDIPQDSPAEGPKPNLDQMLSDLFGQAFKGNQKFPCAGFCRRDCGIGALPCARTY